MKKTRVPFGKVCWVLTAALLLLLPWTAMAQQGEPTEGPPKPAQRLPATEVDYPPGTGYVAPEIGASTVRSVPRTGMGLDAAPMALPDVWDWRDEGGGRVTSVKDQGNCGSCYAFGAIGNIESKMLMDGEGTFDFSENNAKECNYREVNDDPPGWGGCDGGNYRMLIALFAEKGVVLEVDDTYVATDTVSCNSSVTYQKTLLDYREISSYTMPDTDVLKWYIYTYGPVKTSMYADLGQGFNTGYDGTWTFEYPGPGISTNHAVMIVGWSNALPHTPLNPPEVPASGWIVKNSWGDEWGADGYFYVEYGAANVGLWSAFMYDWQDYDPDGGVLDYVDDYGFENAWGCGDGNDWGMVRFTPSADTSATNIEFWTTDITTTVDVYLYDTRNGNNFADLLAQSTGLVYPEPGYHSVLLSSPVQLTNGDDVFAVVRFENGGGSPYPVASDGNGTTEIGRTYLSCSDSPVYSWIDMGASYSTDVSIRLRTSTCPKHYPSLTVGSGETFTLGCDITVEGDLEVQSGGALDLGTYDITVNGLVTNTGTISQTKSVTAVGAGVEFMHITDRAGTTDKYFGVAITPTVASMDSTTVAIQGGQACPSSSSTVMRCFEITPGAVQPATVTFYYRDAEENGQDAPRVWHWTGSAWEQETFDARDLAGVENNWIRVTGVNEYSPFAAANDSPTAVSLARFEAVPSGAAVLVTWETAMEIDNVGFNLYRSEASDGPYVKLNELLIPSQAPGSLFGAEYAWLDETVEPGMTYYYKLEDIEVGGGSTFHGPISVSQNPNVISIAALNAEGGLLIAGVAAGSLSLGVLGLALVRRVRRRD